MPKRPNPMGVNKALTYNTVEAARALKVTTGTIRSYTKRGLPVMTSKRPFLFSGEEIRAFLVQERARKKRPLQLHELFCPACGEGRRPLGLMVDLVPKTDKTALLKGLCEVCDGLCNRIIAKRDTDKLAAIFDIAKRAASDA